MASTQHRIKKYIDEVYAREVRFRYHRQYLREDLLLTSAPIFNL
jgi:hypothetical protein